MKKRFKKIYVEITNVCNLNCNFCPKTKRKAKFMDLKLFEKTIKEANPLCDEITLHLMGEPLIHPQIKEIIELANKENVKINLTTNGTLIEPHLNLLINKTIRRINFSIHGLKSNFTEEKGIEYLKKIIEFTKVAQEEREDLIIIFRLWNSHDSSNEIILKTIEEGFGIKLKDEVRKISSKIKNNSYIHYDNSFEWPSLKNNIRSEKGYCHGLSTHIGILSDGTIVPCCLDNDGNIPLGNIKENTILEVLNFERTKNMIKGFKERKLIENLCKRCTYIERLERNKED